MKPFIVHIVTDPRSTVSETGTSVRILWQVDREPYWCVEVIYEGSKDKLPHWGFSTNGSLSGSLRDVVRPDAEKHLFLTRLAAERFLSDMLVPMVEFTSVDELAS